MRPNKIHSPQLRLFHQLQMLDLTNKLTNKVNPEKNSVWAGGGGGAVSGKEVV